MAPRALCTLPLKQLHTNAISMARVAAITTPRHMAAVEEATRILDGTHPAWKQLWGYRAMCGVKATKLTPAQLEAAERMGLLRRLRGRPPVCSPMFAIAKSDGRTARPIYDARVQNDRIDWTAVRSQLRLCRPLAHVRVGLAVGLRDPWLAEVDAQSYFPSFKWSRRLAKHHGVATPDGFFAHAVPAQGCALMPLVAQIVSAAVADGPVVQAPDLAWVRSRTSIVYDNWLLSAPRHSIGARVAKLTARMRHIGASVGQVKGPAQTLESCGYRFDVRGPKRWSLKPSWCARAAGLLDHMGGTLEERQRQVGVALWAVRAMLLPVGVLHHLLHSLESENVGPEARRELAWCRSLVARCPWRQLVYESSGDPSILRHDQTVVVYSDASIFGAGAVQVGRGSVSWPWEAAAEDQQLLEAEAALRALRWASPAPCILLVVDNEGVAGWLASGNPSNSRAVTILLRIWRLLESRGTALWVTVVPSEQMAADGPSRGHQQQVLLKKVDESLFNGATEVDWSAAKWGRGGGDVATGSSL